MSYPWMVLFMAGSALVAKAAPLYANTTQSTQPTCGKYEWYNPRTSACQSYALSSSCGFTGQNCTASSESCTNNNAWSQNAFDWGCCPQGQVFDYNSGECAEFMDII